MSQKGLNVTLRDPDFSIAISGKLARMLGFNTADNQWVLLEAQGQYIFPRQKADLNASRPSLMSVYTDVILPHHVGNTSAPLIRACAMPKKDVPVGECYNFEFETLHYLPVSQKFIQEIQVEVRGSDGSLIPFAVGILYVRLHFKLRR